MKVSLPWLKRLNAKVSCNRYVFSALDDNESAVGLFDMSKMSEMRICSFLPSATEIIYGLGLADHLYGVSHECDFPIEAQSKTRVVRSRFDSTQMTSGQIDRIVSEFVSKGEQLYEIDLEALDDANPDLVITQELCDVCAITPDDVQKALAQINVRAEILSLNPRSMGDVFHDILRVAERTGVMDLAQKYIDDLYNRVNVVETFNMSQNDHPTVACIEWLDPLMAAGHWIPEMVSIAGGVDVLSVAGEPSQRISLQRLTNASPDIIILMPCGMDIDTAQSAFDNLKNTNIWLELPAFIKNRVYVVDSNSLYSRGGPRLVDGLEIFMQLFVGNDDLGTLSSFVRQLNY